ncbi:exonuclease SbcCD subunit D [Actinotalea fermentans]|uniref:Nuclease SbcCD subunit D n=1 Tax=Actinotalea fermentans TaxID=43671 RepID=A0A511YZD4_9CELL|nr:exonuclease SbcCD subunit D [Actinotalea fermentans]KGM15774.1 exodeoxyribonuclease I [Actinotalea fermentans ATCC 43279 = JCM 9966 = DSM 3133]GEN80567.1 nuclease SbcCD subunit D [Actinotalea fermentans]
MRMLHTSDWHLGRTLHGVDLLGHQAAYLDHLVELVRAESVETVVVAGDVYDRAVPPVEAVGLLADALRRLSETAAVVVTPGNHDSAIRLGFGAELMRPGVHLRARVADVGVPVVLRDEHGPVAVHALPYLDPDAARSVLADDGEPLARSHEAVVGAAMARVRRELVMRGAASGASERVRAVVLAHAFVVGGQGSESERDIRVGGVDAVPAGVFAGVDYVALGHLHGPQEIAFPAGAAAVPDGEGSGGSPPAVSGPAPVLRYSGSPLAYSFSELRHRKSSVLVELGRDGVVGTTLVPAPVPRRLAEVTGTLGELLGAAGDGHEDDWLRAVVTDPVRPPELHARLKSRFPHLLVTEHRPPAGTARTRAAVVTAAQDPVDVAAQFVEHVTGAAPSADELAVLRAAYEQVLAAERSA